jgi:CheY-like chemotaxis protein
MKVALGENLGRVQADATQMEQILINLIVNSRDAMPRGGMMLLETANVDITPGFARQHLGMKPGPYVRVAVTDTGCGMTAETQARIFEPFFTTKEEGRGTGLGLATVYGIVKQSGGYISVQSALNKGSTFLVYLPRTDAPAPARESPITVPSKADGTETIMVVEDEAILRELVCGVLKSRGYQVLEAATGRDALALANVHAGPVDLLLTDVVMPKMNGPELAARMTLERPEIKVLYMSGYADSSVVLHGVRDMNYAYLPKPFTPESLEAKVRQVLDSPSALEAAA